MEEQVFESAANALFRHRNLPEGALGQVRVRFHCLLGRLVLVISATVQDLLDYCDYMRVEKALADQRVDN